MGKCPKCKKDNFAYNDRDLCPDCFDEPDPLTDDIPEVETFQKIIKKKKVER